MIWRFLSKRKRRKRMPEVRKRKKRVRSVKCEVRNGNDKGKSALKFKIESA